MMPELLLDPVKRRASEEPELMETVPPLIVCEQLAALKSMIPPSLTRLRIVNELVLEPPSSPAFTFMMPPDSRTSDFPGNV